MRRALVLLALIVLSVGSVHPAFAEERDVQIKSIDFDAAVLEIHNFGADDIELDGWRFCSHDFDQFRRYTTASGLDGITIEAGTSIFIHFDNDAPVSDDAIDRTDLGSFALPLDPTSYGIQLYFPGATGSVSFSNSALIADHVQWKEFGGDIGDAENRTQQAVNEELWTETGDFVETQPDTLLIELLDLDNGRLHGPEDYAITNPDIQFVRGDADGNGSFLALVDGLFLLEFGFTGGAAPSCEDAADIDDNGELQPILDTLYALSFAFVNGPAIPDPFDECGVDTTIDALLCETATSGCE